VYCIVVEHFTLYQRWRKYQDKYECMLFNCKMLGVLQKAENGIKKGGGK